MLDPTKPIETSLGGEAIVIASSDKFIIARIEVPASPSPIEEAFFRSTGDSLTLTGRRIQNLPAPDYSKGTTPKGREVEFLNGALHSPGCKAKIDAQFLYVFPDHQLSDCKEAPTLEEPNRWDFGGPESYAKVLAGIDEYLDRPKPDCEGHLPTPHEPVKGVTLWASSSSFGTVFDHYPLVKVDGEWIPAHAERHDIGFWSMPSECSSPKNVPAEGWYAFRDRIRSERAAKQPKPYDAESWPKGSVWVRRKGDDSRDLVVYVGVKTVGMTFNFGIVYRDYDCLAEFFEMSLDFGSTWQPCTRAGSEVESA